MNEATLEDRLRASLTACAERTPPRLTDALAYAVFPGGARVRPRLCLEVARAFGRENELTMAAAVAVELLHCASLVHDDLPCFDDADERRGRLSVHKAYDEPTAVLVGDALIVQSFEVLALGLASEPQIGAGPIVVLSHAAGACGGLVAGQAWELEPSVDVARYHDAKTGSLFEAACVLGAISVGAPAEPARALGAAFGRAYQIADDIADRLATAEAMGKPAGRDQALGRPTAALGDREEMMSRMNRAVQQAIDAVPPGPGEDALRGLVRAVLERLCALIQPASAKSVSGRPSAAPRARAV